MPNGLALDRFAQKLYWGDARLDKIERCNYDGTNRQVSDFWIIFVGMTQTKKLLNISLLFVLISSLGGMQSTIQIKIPNK